MTDLNSRLHRFACADVAVAGLDRAIAFCEGALGVPCHRESDGGWKSAVIDHKDASGGTPPTPEEVGVQCSPTRVSDHQGRPPHRAEGVPNGDQGQRGEQSRVALEHRRLDT